MFNIFEQPWTLVVIAFAAYVGVWLWRAIVGEKVSKKYFLIPPALVILAFGVDGLFKTDAEKVNLLIKTSFAAIENEDIDAIDKIISSDYEDSVHNSKAEIITYGQMMLKQMPVRKIKKQFLNLEISGKSAQAWMKVVIHFDSNSQELVNRLVVEARLYFVKPSNKKWLINSTELLKINNHSVSWRKVK